MRLNGKNATGQRVAGGRGRTPRLPSRWFILLARKVHRALLRVSDGRRGLWPARAQLGA